MRTRNIRRRLTIAIVTLVVAHGSALRANAAISTDATDNPHLQRALEHRAAGDPRAAVIELKNAVQQDPNNAEARLLLGVLHLELGDPAAAEKELLRAQRLGVGRQRIIEPLNQARLRLGKFREVLTQALVAKDDPPTRAVAIQVLRGRAHGGLEEWDAARKAFEAALTLDPDHLAALVLLGRVALARKDIDKANEILARARDLAPYDTDILALEGAVAVRNEQYEVAATALAQAAANRPENPGYLLALGEAYLMAGRPAKALAPLTEALEINDRIYLAYYLRGVAYYELKNYEQAEEETRVALSHASKFAPGYFIRGAARLALGNFQGARDDLKYYVQARPDHTHARKLLAEANRRTGRSEQALAGARAMAEQNPDDQALLNLAGVAALRQGDLFAGRAYLEEFARHAPEDSVARARLGWTRFALGEGEAGLADLEAAVGKNSKMPRSELKVIRQYLAARRFDDALRATRRFQRRHLDDSTGVILEAVILRAWGKGDAAAAVLHEAQDSRPGDIRIAHLQAAIAMQGRRFDEAREHYHRVVGRDPDHAPTLLALWRLERRTGNRAAADGWLKRARESLDTALRYDPDDVTATLLRAQVALTENDTETAAPLIEKLENAALIDPRVIALSARLAVAEERHGDAARTYRRLLNIRPSTANVLRLAEAQRRAEQLEGATLTLANWLKKRPEDHRVRFTLGTYYLLLQAWAKSQTVFAALVEAFPKNPVARNNLAWSQFKLGNLEAALDQAKRARELAPDNAGIKDTLEQILAAQRQGAAPKRQ
ncbi:MAG: PEP-CTERM system TPR-repeat protein PrsT [Alphaproteobacteria bacterium]|jgi:putative PEP-CTERM system TPR-repeat lipoprotein|nr:PEP-CTERM system TPR-repeat protein PrsT [Alphaproteobacteria bacterium]